MSTTANGLSRRTLAKGAAWSVPVVAVAGAVPAYAISPKGTVVFNQTGACKLPGNSCKPFRKGYLLVGQLCNTWSNATVTITASGSSGHIGGQPVVWGFDGFVLDGSSQAQKTVTLKPGECVNVKFGVYDRGNSQNTSIGGSLSYNYTAVSSTDPSDAASGKGTVTFGASSVSPCVNCNA